jgi:hypothetical protein
MRFLPSLPSVSGFVLSPTARPARPLGRRRVEDRNAPGSLAVRLPNGLGPRCLTISEATPFPALRRRIIPDHDRCEPDTGEALAPAELSSPAARAPDFAGRLPTQTATAVISSSRLIIGGQRRSAASGVSGLSPAPVDISGTISADNATFIPIRQAGS